MTRDSGGMRVRYVQVVRFNLFGTTCDGDAGRLVDDELEEEFECFRCVAGDEVSDGGQEGGRVRHTDNNRRSLRDFANFLILLHNLLDARLCSI